MLRWNDPVAFIHGLTSRERLALKHLDISTVGELLGLYPRRYDDYSNIVPVAKVPTGSPVTVRVRVQEIQQAPTFRKRFSIIKGLVADESGSILVTWFNQPWLLKHLKKGDEIFISGAVTQRPRFGRGFTSPLWEPANAETLAAGTIAPVYPLASGLSQKTLRKAMKAVLPEVEQPVEWLPSSAIDIAKVPVLSDAYRFVHAPENMQEAEQGRRRMAFGELLSYQLALRAARREANKAGAPAIPFDEAFAKAFVAGLPFVLTPDQKKAVWACVQDMQGEVPMRRLLQGDVGSGKTAVAAMLCALTFRAGASAVCMAPTDVLAKQHAATFTRFLAPHGIPVLLQTSSSRVLHEGGDETTLTADAARERMARGRVVAVGTHALLVRGQAPPDLALAVVDEQHRFGVAQREALTVDLRPDGKVPHLLSMSATPIPRSLALTLHGDLDVSIIRSRPAGRTPIETHVAEGEAGRERAYAAVLDQVSKGHRAFVVCPLIDPSDVLGAKSAEAEAKRLAAGPLKGLRIGIMHGKLANKDKERIMGEFSTGALDVLVATTVVEVGVDVPEATVMLIESAERFGLAQLHQLRGRVGRSTHRSVCFLLTSDGEADPARLRVLERTDDGFEVAEADLKLRGEGNLLGTQQSGQALFKAARLDDLALMATAREVSAQLMAEDATLRKHPALKKIVDGMRETSHQE